jgi:hypothetical protein
MASEVSVHETSLLWAWDKAEHHGKEHVVEQAAHFMLNREQRAERDITGKSQGKIQLPLKSTSSN